MTNVTSTSKNYWAGNGTYQQQFNSLFNELVPSRGQAATIVGEVIRIVATLTYEHANNGNCNVNSDYHYYEQQIDLLKYAVGGKMVGLCNDLKKVIRDRSKCTLDIYTQITDCAVIWSLENRYNSLDLPDWYNLDFDTDD